jgi:hypothetical protein
VQRLLVVCNRLPAEVTYERVTEGKDQLFRRTSLPYGIEIVKWTSPEDDDAVANRARLLLNIE